MLEEQTSGVSVFHKVIDMFHKVIDYGLPLLFQGEI